MAFVNGVIIEVRESISFARGNEEKVLYKIEIATLNSVISYIIFIEINGLE